MIRVYFLPVETIDGTEHVAGIEFIHDALLLCTEETDVRKLIMNTTPEEQLSLSDVALEDRDATQEEIDRYHAQVIPFVPNPDIERIKEILHTSPPPIPAPQVWELFKLFARLRGISV